MCIRDSLQAAKGAGQYKGPVDCARRLLAAEGARGFYRGLGVNLVGVTPEKAIKLAANETFREWLENPDGSIDLGREMLAGASAGFCQVVATNPMELLKIRMQMQATLPVAERQSTVQLVRSLGVRGMYAGTPATLLRDVPFSLLFFPGYANLRALFADDQGGNSLLSNLAAGGLAGAAASGAVTPMDVVKTRLQLAGGRERYGGIPNCFATILREEGPTALFKGVVPRMSVVGPLFAITMLAFEAQKNYMLRTGQL